MLRGGGGANREDHMADMSWRDAIQKVLSGADEPMHYMEIADEIVASSLDDYLKRHPDMAHRLTRNGTMEFFTTDDPDDFNEHATIFFGQEVRSQYLKV